MEMLTSLRRRSGQTKNGSRCNFQDFHALTKENHVSLRRNFREEHSMDQYRSRPKLSENFERHWSIQISGEIHMDQSLVHTFSWGNSYGPMVLKVLRKFPPTLVLVHGWLFPEFPHMGRCPSTVPPVFPVLVFQLSKQQNHTLTTSPNRTRTKKLSLEEL